MTDNNKHNILYFESATMKELHKSMDKWQKDNEKRYLSMSVEKDGDLFCCMALTNPSEVLVVNYYDNLQVPVEMYSG